MRIYEYHREQRLGRPLRRLFPFFERPENLALITPPSLDFRLLTPTPVVMEQGRIIDYTIRLLGVGVRWRTVISTYRPPYCFVDEQLLGPYSFWHHTHRFAEEGSVTRMVDDVRYVLPALVPVPLGAAANHWYVRPTLERIFDFRRDQLRRLFGDVPGKVTTTPAAARGDRSTPA